MTDEDADVYAKRALELHRTSPFEVVVGFLYVSAVTNAFERLGYTVETDERLGRLVIARVVADLPEAVEVLALRDQVGSRLVRYVRSGQLSNFAAGMALGATEKEIGHLRRGRYREIGDERLADMERRLEA